LLGSEDGYPQPHGRPGQDRRSLDHVVDAGDGRPEFFLDIDQDQYGIGGAEKGTGIAHGKASKDLK
jgi:hypothetical protein